MLNQFVVVGRVTKYRKIDNSHAKLKIIVNRDFKNNEGLYESDVIPIELTGSIMDNVQQYCKKGDIVGIKGRMMNRNNLLILKADKVSFLASKTKEEE